MKRSKSNDSSNFSTPIEMFDSNTPSDAGLKIDNEPAVYDSDLDSESSAGARAPVRITSPIAMRPETPRAPPLVSSSSANSPANPHSEHSPGWFGRFRNVVYNTVTAMSSALVGDGGEQPAESSRLPDSRRGQTLREPYSDHSMNYAMPVAEEPIHLDLVSTIRNYNRFPMEANFMLVRSALLDRNKDLPVTPEELIAASADMALLQLVVETAFIDTNNPEIRTIVQRGIDVALLPDRQTHLVPVLHLVFLANMLRLRCATVSEEQLHLMCRSGFEFVILIEENQHVLRNRILPMSSVLFWVEASRSLQPLFVVLGLIIVYGDVATTGMVLIEHYLQGRNYSFNATLLTWLGSVLLGFIAVKVGMTTMVPASRYGERISDIPSATLRLPPFMPLMETVTAVNALRHRCASTATSFLTHDLFALFMFLRLVHALFLSLPQVLLQSYLAGTLDDPMDSRSRTMYEWQRVSALLSMFTAMPLFIHFIVTHTSVNSIGFAVPADKIDKSPPSRFALTIAMVLIFMLVFNIFNLVISSINLKQCNTSMVALLVFAAAITLVTTILFLATLRNTRNVVRACRWLALPILIQVGYTVVINVYKFNSSSDSECRLFFTVGNVNMVFGYVGWGILLGLAGAWSINKIYRSLKNDSQSHSHEPVEALPQNPLQSVSTAA